ncbi:MAG: RHS repeat-associated core domain-containing protein [Gemmatimonadota bacterium]
MATRFALVLLASLFTPLRLVSATPPAASSVGASEAPPEEAASRNHFEVIRWGSVGQLQENTTGHTAQFRIFNDDPNKITVSLSCSGTGPVSNCSAPSSFTIFPEAFRTVTVTFDVGTAGTGLLTLTATDNGHSTSDSHNVLVVAHGPLSLDATVNPTELIERSACVTSGAGPAGAFQCGNLLVTHSMPAFKSLDRDRTLTLLYNSATASPRPVVMGDVWLDGISVPDSFRTSVKVGQVTETRSFQGAGLSSAAKSRFSMPYDAGALGTGIHDYDLNVVNYYGTEPFATAVFKSKFITVDRSQSPYGAGWWIAGVSELYTSVLADTLLLVEGDGSAAAYIPIGPNLWRAPAGAFQDTIEWKQLDDPSPDVTAQVWLYERRLQDGTNVYFNQYGQQVYVTDRVGNVVGHTYQNTTLGAGLTQVRIAPWAANLTYDFVYGVHGLAFIDDPAGRRLNTNVSSEKLLLTILPVGLWIGEEVVLGYETGGLRRLTSRRSPRGATTTYAYHGETLLLSTVTLPATGSGTAVLTYKPIESRGLAQLTAGNAVASAARTNIVIDGPRTTVGDSAVFWVNRFGSLTKIRDAAGNETTVAYDLTHPLLVTAINEPDGTQIRQRWDTSARLEMTQDLANLSGADSVHYDYADADAPEKPSRVIRPRGDSAAADTTLFSYNADGTPETATTANGHVTRFTYEQGQVKTITEESVEVYNPATNTTSTQNLTTTFEYGGNRNLKRTISPTSDSTDIVSRDAYGNVKEVLSAEGRRQTFQYDLRNRRTHVEQWEGAQKFTTATDYDGADNATRVTDPRGLTREWEFDELERDTLMRDSRGYTALTRHDVSGNVVWQKDRQGDTITTQYDAMNRPINRILGQIMVDDQAELDLYRDLMESPWSFNPMQIGDTLVVGDTITWQYDVAGRVKLAENATSQVVRTYNSRGLLTKEVQNLTDWAANASYTQDYTYDLAGNRASWTWPYQPTSIVRTVTYTYGAGNELSTVSGALGPSATFAWDGLGRKHQLAYSSGSTTDFHYDANGRLGRVHSTHTQQLEDPVDQRYTYDRDGNLIREEDHGERRVTTSGFDLTVSQYNGRDAVTHVDVTQNSTTTPNRFHYDAAGNRTGIGGGDSTVHVVDLLGNMTVEIQSPTGTALDQYTHDKNGNEVRHLDGIGVNASNFARYYNAAGQLTAAFPLEKRFRYDPFGRRVGIGLTDTINGGIGTTRVIFDGDNVAFYGDGQGGGHFTPGPGTDDPLFLDPLDSYSCDGEFAYFYVTHGGRLFDFQNADGDDCADPGGVGGVFAAFGSESGAVADSRGFGLSRSTSDASGIGGVSLSFFRNRFYNSQTGKFTQEDPIGFGGGINLYNYGGNNPASFIDPFGLCVPFPDCALQEIANRGAIRGGFFGSVMLNGAAALNGLSEAAGVNALLGAASERDAVGTAVAAVSLVPIGRAARAGRIASRATSGILRPLKRGAGGRLQPFNPTNGQFESFGANSLSAIGARIRRDFNPDVFASEFAIGLASGPDNPASGRPTGFTAGLGRALGVLTASFLKKGS